MGWKYKIRKNGSIKSIFCINNEEKVKVGAGKSKDEAEKGAIICVRV
jgi:hypothetical protein